MFEGIVASFLNRCLGKYIEDLDSESLNVGIFSGNVELTNLKVKAEALYELGLPISVKQGSVGKLSLNIPWSRLSSQPSVVNVEEIFILAGPAITRKYDHELEKKLLRAEKKRILDQLDPNSSFLPNASSEKFAETLIASILNNLKVFIHKVHVRYEDSFTNQNLPVSVGVCLHSFSIENTNSNWKPMSNHSRITPSYQIAKIESLSIYCNSNSSEILLEKKNDTELCKDWIHYMRHSLETFKFVKENLDFIMKPTSARFKIIINKSSESLIPKLLVDFVLQDAALQLSHKQYLALLQLQKSFHRISINRMYRKFHPEVPVTQDPKKWWKYAGSSVIHHVIKPYTWSHLKSHRENYRAYCETYKMVLLNLSTAENRVDLQRIEDTLNIHNIIIAREHTKLKLYFEEPEKVILREYFPKSLFFIGGSSQYKRHKLSINDRRNGLLNQLSPNEKNCLYEMIGCVQNTSPDDKSKLFMEKKFNFTVVNFNISLISGGCEILVMTVSDILTSIETYSDPKTYKMSTCVESIVIEGASVEFGLIPIVTSENVLRSDQNINLLKLEFEKNPISHNIDYVLSVACDSLEIIYHEFSFSTLASFLHAPTLNFDSLLSSTICKSRNFISQLTVDSLSRYRSLLLNIDFKLPRLIIPNGGSYHNYKNVMVVDLGYLKIWSDLQVTNFNFEDATVLELEEKLYDRFHITFKDCQILMFSHGEDWKTYIKLRNSPFHILSKIHSQIVFSNSIKPNYKLLPRCKLNVSLQSLKISISDKKIITLQSFIRNLPCPRNLTIFDNTDDLLLFDHVSTNCDINSLEILQFVIACRAHYRAATEMLLMEEENKTFLSVDKYNNEFL